MDKIAKAIVAAVTAGAGAYGVAVADGIVTAAEWATIAVTTLTALGLVWGVPNAPNGQTQRTEVTFTSNNPVQQPQP